MKYLVDQNGTWLGAFEDDADIPDSTIVPVAPSHPLDVWDFQAEAWIPYAPPPTKYFVDAQGVYLGGFAGSEPDGGIEVSTPPDDGRQIWSGTEWLPCPPVVPEIISDRQFFQALAKPQYALITEAEALAAVKTGEVPAALATIIAALPEEAQFDANMLVAGATQFTRHNHLVGIVGAAFGWTEQQIDEFWIFAHSL